MRVGILTVQVPFVRGGAEAHAENLQRALHEAGHAAEIISVPFKWYPPAVFADQMLACRLFDIEESCGVAIDRVIGLKFPAYLIPHSNKVLWVLHQHRSAYDLWEKPHGDLHPHDDGLEVASLIRHADMSIIPQARRVYANSANVADRLRRFCGIESQPLYHPPPQADSYAWQEDGDFLLVPGRLNALKRQELVVEALRLTRQPVRVCFIGAADEARYADRVRELAGRLPGDRTTWLGQVSDARKFALYGSCLGVIVPPVDEDYGYVTLEAMLSSKPVISCTDSGGPLEFVSHAETGLVCDPEAPLLARAMDELWEDRSRAKRMGRSGRLRYDALGLSWSSVVETLLA